MTLEKLPNVNISDNKKLVNISLPCQFVGDFILNNNTKLPSIGMASLENITGTFLVESNPALSSLSLPSLEFVGGSFVLSGNDKLSSLDLDQLTGLSGNVSVSSNAVLTDVDLNPKIFSGFISIENNNLLQDISGFQLPASFSGVQVVSNPALLSISGFNSVTTISTGLCSYHQFDLFVVQNNPSLEKITGFQSLSSVSQTDQSQSCSFQITDNPALTSMSGLKSLSSVQLFVISMQISNTGLTSMDDLSSLVTVNLGNPYSGQGFIINNNPGLESIDGLGSITTLSASVDIFSNGALANCLTTLCYLCQVSPSGCDSTTGNGPFCTDSYCTN